MARYRIVKVIKDDPEIPFPVTSHFEIEKRTWFFGQWNVLRKDTVVFGLNPFEPETFETEMDAQTFIVKNFLPKKNLEPKFEREVVSTHTI